MVSFWCRCPAAWMAFRTQRLHQETKRRFIPAELIEKNVVQRFNRGIQLTFTDKKIMCCRRCSKRYHFNIYICIRNCCKAFYSNSPAGPEPLSHNADQCHISNKCAGIIRNPLNLIQNLSREKKQCLFFLSFCLTQTLVSIYQTIRSILFNR